MYNYDRIRSYIILSFSFLLWYHLLHISPGAFTCPPPPVISASHGGRACLGAENGTRQAICSTLITEGAYPYVLHIKATRRIWRLRILLYVSNRGETVGPCRTRSLLGICIHIPYIFVIVSKLFRLFMLFWAGVPAVLVKWFAHELEFRRPCGRFRENLI